MPDTGPETIAVAGHGPPETWPGLFRAVICVAGAVAIGWFDHGVTKYALGVVALVASPSLARAVIAPFLARILKGTP